jgi:hypothetical protein
MTIRDLHNRLDDVTSVAPAVINATATGTGADLAGYRVAEVLFVVGTITDGTHTPKLQESDVVGSGYTDVAAGDQSGTLAALATNTNQKVSYLGTKRFIRAVVTVAAGATGGAYSAVVLRGKPSKR